MKIRQLAATTIKPNTKIYTLYEFTSGEKDQELLALIDSSDEYLDKLYVELTAEYNFKAIPVYVKVMDLDDFLNVNCFYHITLTTDRVYDIGYFSECDDGDIEAQVQFSLSDNFINVVFQEDFENSFC